MTLMHGDCIEVMCELDECSIDALVTDPPYGIGFMGHDWDQPGDYGPLRANGNPRPFASGGDRRELERQIERSQRRGRHHQGTGFDTRPGDHGAFEAGRYDFSPAATQRFQHWCEAWATEALRVLKPGAHALVFGGTRTYHRLACGLEDAGFEIRDCLVWLYGSGFPKSLDVSKAIDKQAGAEREVVSQGSPVKRMIPGADQNATGSWIKDNGREYVPTVTAAATPDAERWQGWGTALKPAHEPIVVARKPLGGTVAANVLKHGTGAINVDGCRVDVDDRSAYERNHSGDRGHAGTRSIDSRGSTDLRPGGGSAAEGRWPANVVLDEEAAALLDEQTSGGASRFFYCAKTSRVERNAGLEGFAEEPSLKLHPTSAMARDGRRGSGVAANHHPTVKPIALMRWLVRLVNPVGGGHRA